MVTTVCTACDSTSDVSGATYVYGGVAGNNFESLNECYWSGVPKGVGTGPNNTTQVDGSSVTWESATAAMNDACEGLYSTADPTNPPKLKWEN